MPEMDGFEVLKYMNKNHLIEEVPVMIISIEKDDKSIEKAYELGVSGYITRPFSSAVVLKKINNIISHYKRQKKLTTIINKQYFPIFIHPNHPHYALLISNKYLF